MRAGLEKLGDHGEDEGERQTPQNEERWITGCQPHLGGVREDRLASGWHQHCNNQERTKSQAGTLPRQKAAEQEFGV